MFLTNLNPVVVLALTSLALADLHRLFVGNLNAPASIHVLQFDDEALTLNKTETIRADSPHSWIAFGNDKNNIYGVSLSASRVASYSIHWNMNSTLHLDRVIKMQGNCTGKNSAFVLQSPNPPNAVYTAQWPGPNSCGMVTSVFDNGTLSNVIQTWKYNTRSGVHGLSLGPGANTLYSADLSGDAVWTHSVDSDGKVSEVAMYPMPRAGMHPRHLTAHPSGNYLYVVMEAGNSLVAYSLDGDTGAPNNETASYSLIPEGQNTKNYWSVEPMLSHSKQYLWATARAEANTNLHGYISCFLLDNDGAILSRLFMVPTTTVNGIANAVSPAPFSDEWMALADNPTGYVQIWRLGDNGNGTTAVPVARVDLKDGGCCANAIWYD